MDINIEEQDDLYCVCVQIPPYNTRIKRKTIVNTKDVRAKLLAEGYDVGEVIQESYLHNLSLIHI